MKISQLLNKLFPALLVFVLLSLLNGLFLIKPQSLHSAGTLSNAAATLSNSRLSYFGRVLTGITAGQTVVRIITTGNIADKNTSGLFPNDTVSIGSSNYIVASIADSGTFVLKTAPTAGVAESTAIYGIQTTTLAATFNIGSTIPANGKIKVTIPDPASGWNDGLPETDSSTANNGFDLNTMATTDVGTTGGTGCNWSGTETLGAGVGVGHSYTMVTTSACTTGTVTVTFDGASKDLVLPAPLYSGHTQGTADVYTVTIETLDSTNTVIDTVDVKVAPVEAVLVSATVDETLSFAVAGVGISTSICGTSANITTTATTIPWGTLATADTFSDAAQTLTLSTNADGGYAVTIEENDQMGLNGKTCTGASAGESVQCIKDTVCNAACTETTSAEWTTASNSGLGYSLKSISGGHTAFSYNESSRTFSAKQLADMETTGPAETKQTIMSHVDPVNGDSIYVCYRIAISPTQPAGYYYNKVKYIATATF